MRDREEILDDIAALAQRFDSRHLTDAELEDFAALLRCFTDVPNGASRPILRVV